MNNPKISLKYYRELKGLSQRQLSVKLNISQGYISSIESGKKSPTVRMIYRIASILEICPRLLLPCIIKCSTRCDFEESLK